MPQAPRPQGKPMKIAFKILGTPPNLTNVKTKAKKRINQRLVFEETKLVR